MISQTEEGVWRIDGDSHGSLSVESHRRLDWDLPMLQALKPFIPVGGIVLDLGANIGTHCKYYQDAVGPEGVVVAIEPGLEPYECLCRNCPRARKYNLALGDHEGRCSMSVVEESTALSFVEPGNSVRMTTLDVLWQEIGYGRLDFVKLDVEGYEVAVLEGARQVIAKYGPVMCVEVSEKALTRAGTSLDAVYGFFVSMDYRFQRLSEGWADILATPNVCSPEVHRRRSEMEVRNLLGQ